MRQGRQVYLNGGGGHSCVVKEPVSLTSRYRYTEVDPGTCNLGS